ncbi:hypothetical protein [Natrialba taiwanensis]|uniref:hypothetical protein n=1 Tax=Natrialba taiwanensis TaxID=160846 RepID=UPI001268C50C|nr:hypothetical protein [Natrialba taiwanensis]
MIDDNLAQTITDVISLCNNAIHTTGINHDKALEIIEIGKSVLSDIKWRYHEIAVTPSEDVEEG